MSTRVGTLEQITLLLMGIVTPSALPMPTHCTLCGTDPSDDLYPRAGLLCHWCDELKTLQETAKMTLAAGCSGGGDLGPMRARGTNSMGPRRAPAISRTKVRQYHDFQSVMPE